jgi:hypothetical protein
MSLRSRLLAALRAPLGAEAVPLRVVFRDGEAFDLAPDPAVTITLHSRRLLRLFLTGGMARLAQAYVAGELTAAPGSKFSMSRICARTTRRPSPTGYAG